MICVTLFNFIVQECFQKVVQVCLIVTLVCLFSEITITGTLHPDRGTVMTLMCNASGAITPPESIDWFKDGIKIVQDNKKKIDLLKGVSYKSRTITSILTKTHTEMSDAGTYSCRTSDLQVTSEKVNVLNSTYVKTFEYNMLPNYIKIVFNLFNKSTLRHYLYSIFYNMHIHILYTYTIFSVHFFTQLFMLQLTKSHTKEVTYLSFLLFLLFYLHL